MASVDEKQGHGRVLEFDKVTKSFAKTDSNETNSRKCRRLSDNLICFFDHTCAGRGEPDDPAG